MSSAAQGLEIADSGRGNRIEVDPSVQRTGGLRIVIQGDDNQLRIGPGVRLGSGLIELRNSRGWLEIGAKALINGQLRLRADDARLEIGGETTMMQAIITLHEAGRIVLGRDCMLSGEITMDVSDMHSILDAATGARINPPEDIEIGDHVWLGHGVRVLKGARIGADCVIGSRALVTGAIPGGSIAVGMPARVVRSGVTWDRRRLPWI